MTYHNFFTLIENETMPTLPNATSKKEKIIKLLSQENYSTKNIAEMVGTTKGYVWKEKSKLKTAGLLIKRDTEVISRTSQLNINNGNNNSLLNIPQLAPEGLSKLYSEFRLGKRPAQVISKYGFHPELVESEYQRFLRLENEYDTYTLQIKFFQNFEQQLLTSKYYNNELNPLVEKYRKNGKLVADDFIGLIKTLLKETYVVGKVSAIDDLMNKIPPVGWEAGRCINCNEVLGQCIVNSTKESRIILSDTSIPLTHSSFGIRCPQVQR